MHEEIGNQFIELIYGVSAIDAEDNAKYAKTLMIIAGADGTLHDREWTWFYERGKAMGVPSFVLDSFKEFDWKNARLEDYCGSNRSVARMLIYDAVTMSQADGVYQEAEAQAIRKAASLLGVSHDAVDAIEGLVGMEAALQKTRHRLLRSAEYQPS